MGEDVLLAPGWWDSACPACSSQRYATWSDDRFKDDDEPAVTSEALQSEPSVHAETVQRLAEVTRQRDDAKRLADALEFRFQDAMSAREAAIRDRTRVYWEGFVIGAAAAGSGITAANGHWSAFAFYVVLGVVGLGVRARGLMRRG